MSRSSTTSITLNAPLPHTHNKTHSHQAGHVVIRQSDYAYESLPNTTLRCCLRIQHSAPLSIATTTTMACFSGNFIFNKLTNTLTNPSPFPQHTPHCQFQLKLNASVLRDTGQLICGCTRHQITTTVLATTSTANRKQNAGRPPCRGHIILSVICMIDSLSPYWLMSIAVSSSSSI